MVTLKKLLKSNKNNKGFTLMELIIVVAIIAILIALIAPNLVGFIQSAEDTALESNAKECYTAASAWATQQRIAGKKVGDKTITVKKSGASNDVSGDAKTSLEETMNISNFATDDKCVITVSNGAVTKVVWTSGNGGTATYPKEKADK